MQSRPAEARQSRSHLRRFFTQAGVAQSGRIAMHVSAQQSNGGPGGVGASVAPVTEEAGGGSGGGTPIGAVADVLLAGRGGAAPGAGAGAQARSASGTSESALFPLATHRFATTSRAYARQRPGGLAMNALLDERATSLDDTSERR